LLILNGDDPEGINDEEIYIGYRRPELVNDTSYSEEDELPEYVRWRLFLARQLALLKYREIHG
jgi:hypothetical protein